MQVKYARELSICVASLTNTQPSDPRTLVLQTYGYLVALPTARSGHGLVNVQLC